MNSLRLGFRWLCSDPFVPSASKGCHMWKYLQWTMIGSDRPCVTACHSCHMSPDFVIFVCQLTFWVRCFTSCSHPNNQILSTCTFQFGTCIEKKALCIAQALTSYVLQNSTTSHIDSNKDKQETLPNEKRGVFLTNAHDQKWCARRVESECKSILCTNWI